MNEKKLPSPCFLLNVEKLKNNLSLIKQVAQETKIEIIFALKSFAMWQIFPIIKEYIHSATASSLHEVILCNDKMQNKAHTYAVAYKASEIDRILDGSSHIIFNSMHQYRQFEKKAQKKKVSIGLRINPELTNVSTELYNPTLPNSRLGITIHHLKDDLPANVEGLHFHALCESNSFDLEKILKKIDLKYSHLLKQIKWINMGGGHLITKEDYCIEHLISLLKDFKSKYNLDIILEPGSAFTWQTGTLKTSILDIIKNKKINTAIIDASFTCHMPDCLEMPYRPDLKNGYTDQNKGKYKYQLGGISCLAGDFLEAYSFDQELKTNDEIEFLDMMHYTMVKTTTFNGIQHPAIAIKKLDGEIEIIKEFGYQDYLNKLS